MTKEDIKVVRGVRIALKGLREITECLPESEYSNLWEAIIEAEVAAKEAYDKAV